MRLAPSPNPLIFPETNYPNVRDLTHKFRAAGGFSDFNHTSMLAAQSNLHCLSHAPALCQLCIDHYQASALYSDSSQSAHRRFDCASPRGGRKNSRRGLGQWGTEGKSDDFLMKLPLILRHADAVSVSVSRESEQMIWSYQRGITGCVKLCACEEWGETQVIDS